MSRLVVGGLAGVLLLGAVLLRLATPLQAQDGAIAIRFDRLSDAPTHATVDRFWVEVTHLNAAAAYEITVTSDTPATLGIDGCGQATQTQAVTGVTAETVTFLVYVCTEGGGTLTAAVRRVGADAAAATVSRRLTVTPLTAGVPEDPAEAQAVGTAALRAAAVARIGTPGIVPNVRFSNRTSTSFDVSWDEPSNGGGENARITGYGVLRWRDGTSRPPWGSAVVVHKRSKTFDGLRPNTKYWVMVHACNGADSCGWWTTAKSVWTLPSPTNPTPTQPTKRAPGRVRNLTVTAQNGQLGVTWNQPEDSGSSHFTGYHVQHRRSGAGWPTGAAVVTPGTTTWHTIANLTNGVAYDVRVQACNGHSRCGSWRSQSNVVPRGGPAPPPPPPTPTAVAGAPGQVTGLDDTSSGNRSVSIRWSAPGNPGSAALAGYQVQNRVEGSPWPAQGHDDVRGRTSHTIQGLIDGTRYEFRVRACNQASLCGLWVTVGPVTAGNKVGTASLDPDSATIQVGQRVKFGIHDIPVGKVGRTYLVGPIQPAGRCGAAAQAAQAARGPSTGPGYYDAVWIEGCAPGGTAWLRVVNPEETELYASAKITVQAATHPGQVGQPTVDARDAALYVDWTAPGDGGAAISHHDIRYRAGTSGPWTQTRVPPTATETVPTDMTVSSLSNGTAYQVQVRACNTHGCGDWSPTATGTPSAMAPGETIEPPAAEPTVFVPCGTEAEGRLAKPANLTVAPVLQRQAVLMWRGTTGATRYVVSVRKFGDLAWEYPVHLDITSAEVEDPCYTIRLDKVMKLFGGTTIGLADHDAFQFRVTARDATNERKHSDVVTVVDTPITRANGDSRFVRRGNGPGLAEITWTPLHQQVAGLPSNGEYQLRHRHPLGDHTRPDWNPSIYSTFADPIRQAASPQEVGNLELRQLYAIQLTYDSDNSGTPDVFAARDVYVWPSRTQAKSGRRIAGFPVVRTLRNATFTYRICSETFLVEGKTRRTAWLNLIRDAAARWQAAVTTDLVTFSEQAGPCISYDDIADDWAQIVWNEVMRLRNLDPPITDLNTLAAHIETFVTRTREEQMRLWTPFRVRIATRNIQDKAYNEILLFDDESASLKTLIKYRVFDELANDLGSTKPCWYARGDTPNQGIGCADTQGFKGPFGETHFTTDIFFRRSAFVDDALAVPGSDAKMNFCGFGANAGGAEGVGSAYATAGHEIGHALGITSYAGADNSLWSLPGHPPYSTVDSIMSYNDQPRCAPYALDLMAIHALYQTVD